VRIGGGVPGEVAKSYEHRKKVITGRGLRLFDVVRTLQATTSKKRIFLCIDALD